ncbi:MAG: glycoside hydrolase family 99-like domain-containing protein, partial [Pirellulaceae bacterium]
YDESNPECVDWQIKWAVENGIRCFLVDWYWVDGHRQLEHWLEAYRKARYRDDLQIALMWANHNPPKTHSRQDWRRVTQHWIKRYFPLNTYYQLDGKPAMFIWSPQNIRDGLGGTSEVKKALAESQAMAQQAGYPGISFVALGYGFSQSRINTLLDEGYVGITTYHEWGMAGQGATTGRAFQFNDVVRTAAAAWEQKQNRADSLSYYPVVDTGWDSRPWHGEKSLVIAGRTPALFETLLEQAKSFCQRNGKKMVVLGPVNEWGEGSYIEPCTEFGFSMLESVRRVFAKGDPAQWPVNVAPADVGLGPYDFPVRPRVTAWTFDHDIQGWSPMMGMTDFSLHAGAARFRTITYDPAMVVGLQRVQASAFPKVAIRMQIIGKLPAGAIGQLFWSSGGRPLSGAASVRFPLADDGQMHTYELDLAANSRWRGQVTTLRFDPCPAKDVTVLLDHFELRP